METQGTLQKNFGLAVWLKTKEKARERVRAQRAANLYLAGFVQWKLAFLGVKQSKAKYFLLFGYDEFYGKQ